MIFRFFMVLVYTGMAVALLFTSLFEGHMAAGVRYSVGVLFLIYGIFRGYREIRNMRKEDHDE